MQTMWHLLHGPRMSKRSCFSPICRDFHDSSMKGRGELDCSDMIMLARKTRGDAGLPPVAIMSALIASRDEREMIKIGLSFDSNIGLFKDGVFSIDRVGNAPGIFLSVG